MNFEKWPPNCLMLYVHQMLLTLILKVRQKDKIEEVSPKNVFGVIILYFINNSSKRVVQYLTERCWFTLWILSLLKKSATSMETDTPFFWTNIYFCRFMVKAYANDIRVHTNNIWMTYEHIRVTYEWYTSTYERDTNDIRVHTSDMRMIYEYIRVTYEWHTSTHEWHTSDIQMTYEWHTNDIQVHMNGIRMTYEWHTGT